MPNDVERVAGVVVHILPEVLSFIKSFYQDNNRFPTEEELLAKLIGNRDRIVAISDKWLSEHPVK